jgi:anti-sigma factor RsiW
MITCRLLLDLIPDYLEAELPSPQRDEFERHLAACRPCTAYLRSYETTVRLGRALGQRDAERASEVPDALVDAIVAARAGVSGSGTGAATRPGRAGRPG